MLLHSEAHVQAITTQVNYVLGSARRSHPGPLRAGRGSRSSRWLARAVLPDADDVARGVADGCDGSIAFLVGQGDHLCAPLGRLAERVIELGDVDVGPDSGFPGGGQVGAPVPDDVAGAVAEARLVPWATNLPAEDRPVEVRGLCHIVCGDPEIGDTAGPGHRGLDARVCRCVVIGHRLPLLIQLWLYHSLM